MSLNSFVNNLNGNETNDINIKTEPVNLTKLESLDNFLNSTVVDKFNQPWRSLTKFLKKNRMIRFLDDRNDEYTLIEKKSIMRRLSLGKIENKCVEYDQEKGEITKLTV
jgi:hypothetical protein